MSWEGCPSPGLDFFLINIYLNINTSFIKYEGGGGIVREYMRGSEPK